MKKTICIIVVAVVIVTALFGCYGCNCSGYDFVDTNYHFNRAIIRTPNGDVIEVNVKMWADSEGEQLTITATDGTRYLVHAANCLMIEDN